MKIRIVDILRKTKILVLVATALTVNSVCLSAQSIVASSSKVSFVIKNVGIGVDGTFSGLAGTIKFDPKNLKTSSFDVTVDASTVDTKNSMRDEHLRKADYFDVATYKTIRLKSTSVTSKGNDVYNFVGTLTIKGKTVNIAFDFTAKPNNGAYIFDTKFNINRMKFGVGGKSAVLSDMVAVKINVVTQ